ncbi:MAG TPA: fructose-bisphosphatase class II [candidate division Zixibacteria bacterium]|nr:fructose-bisphosphatase class II [candidate division Zixibacteria bacterium]MDM7974197.1 fructose-bisphosphatase class II [candidate division Zixibacteria bacterium]HOD66886.1 fructose-bisphosphatase class II [candidate division Zixibacteria bacterium]HPM38065.1 fructose-bisphosphatase class II [candidate division Zixibacteria bacterium]
MAKTVTNSELRFDVGANPIRYCGMQKVYPFSRDRVVEINLHHQHVLEMYDLELVGGTAICLADRLNERSNLGALRNRKLREAAVASAALSAVAVSLHGRGSLAALPKDKQTKEVANELKRANDRTSAQVMAEVLQTTTETLSIGEEVLIESTITEGVRAKPGKEVGGNPTIAVGALFGKKEHRARYGLDLGKDVTLLSMGNDVIDGTTKSVKGLHSSMTCMFLIESQVKRHLPDIYVQRWMGGAHFDEFNPREGTLLDAARVIADSYGFADLSELSAFFIDRSRHYPAWDTLGAAGIGIPYDADGDLFPALLLGLEGMRFPNGRHMNSMIGEIGGSAEWVVGALPLVWRGGQALGMLTSHSSLSRRDLSPEDLWNSRFHYTEDELIMIQDARFQQKPYFSVKDIIENPHAGGISAFGAITDSVYLPFMKGVQFDPDKGKISVWTLVINSLGLMEVWEMHFACRTSLAHTRALIASPKERLAGLRGKALEAAIGKMLDDPREERRYRIFFNNEYYPALVPIREKVALLGQALEGLIARGALNDQDREIIDLTARLAPEWWVENGR